MTVEAGVEASLELLVGEMPPIPCEHSAHNEDRKHHDTGNATHMLQGRCPGCKQIGPLQAVCATYVSALFVPNLKSRCDSCGHRDEGYKFIHVLTPIT